ncbi:unnamed protein product [marine sediment metagenome]|uniref:Uncharacterized protein n=1 Tax=marine sediment metagenome TaxID=412755 RepID=X1DQE2_9ZZZZ
MDHDQLLDYMFIGKVDKNWLKYWLEDKYKTQAGDRKVKSIAYAYEMELRKKITDKHHLMIDNIFTIKEAFSNITLIEAIAINKRQLEKWITEPRKEPLDDDEWHEVLNEAINYHINNWTSSMKNLNKNKK